MLDAPQTGLSLADLGLSDTELQAILREGLQIIVEGIAQTLTESVAGVATARDLAQIELLSFAATASTSFSLTAIDRAIEAFHGCRNSPGLRHVPGPEVDLLIAPLRDRRGEFQAILWVGVAPGRVSPSDENGTRIAAYAAQAERELQAGVERHRLHERARLAETARQVVRTATSRLDLQAALHDCEGALLTGFLADEVGVRSYPAAGIAEAGTRTVDITPDAARVVHHTARRCWAEQRVAVVTADTWPGDLLSEADHAVAAATMTDLGLGSCMLVPLGAGAECLGHLLLARADEEHPWSAEEARVALEIGHDLGRAIRVAQSFERERQFSERLLSLDAAKGRLITTVCHELKTPLSTIVGHLELVESAPELGDTSRRSLEAITRSTGRLRRVVDDLLLLSTVGNPTSSRSPTAVDVGDIVEDVCDLVAVAARRANILIRFETPRTAVKAWGDHGELDRALGNLVGNAVKYSEDHGTVTLALARVADEVVFTCTDEGLGISPEDQTLLFTEFFRSTNPLARERPGTGLGLAIVRRIVDRHRGRIEVESALGVGSTFRVFLPAVAASP